MHDLAIRITIGGIATRESILEYFKTYDALITEEHLETNHHLNILFTTNIQVTTFRNKMNRHFRCIKNQSYCRLDKGNYGVYILKEDNVIENRYCSEEELVSMKKRSYTKKDKPPSFHYSIVLNFVYKDPYCFPINEYIAKYVIESLAGTLHDDFIIQRIGNAIASKYYLEIYIKKSGNFNFMSIYNN